MYTTDNGYGTEWSRSVSHELINMLTDPRANLVAAKYKKDGSAVGTTFYAYEPANPCGGASSIYRIDGVAVSDFVLPAWFSSEEVNGSGFLDFMNQANIPFTLCAGGTAQFFEAKKGDWRTISSP